LIAERNSATTSTFALLSGRVDASSFYTRYSSPTNIPSGMIYGWAFSSRVLGGGERLQPLVPFLYEGRHPLQFVNPDLKLEGLRMLWGALIIAPSIKTEGKVFQRAQKLRPSAHASCHGSWKASGCSGSGRIP
jgi:hypothetical protein